MNDLLTIILGGIATWRLSHLLINERGFLHIFIFIRHFVGIRYFYGSKELTLSEVIANFSDLDGAEIYTRTHIAELFTCIYCMSVWVSGILLLLLFYNPDAFKYFSVFLSFSAIAIFLERLKNA